MFLTVQMRQWFTQRGELFYLCVIYTILTVELLFYIIPGVEKCIVFSLSIVSHQMAWFCMWVFTLYSKWHQITVLSFVPSVKKNLFISVWFLRDYIWNNLLETKNQQWTEDVLLSGILVCQFLQNHLKRRKKKSVHTATNLPRLHNKRLSCRQSFMLKNLSIHIKSPFPNCWLW